MPKRITICELTVTYVPLPPERRAQYMAAIRLLARLMLDLEPVESVPAQAGSPLEFTRPLSAEVLPGLGLTTQVIPLSSESQPVGAISDEEIPVGAIPRDRPSLPDGLAQNTTGISG